MKLRNWILNSTILFDFLGQRELELAIAFDSYALAVVGVAGSISDWLLLKNSDPMELLRSSEGLGT